MINNSICKESWSLALFLCLTIAFVGCKSDQKTGDEDETVLYEEPWRNQYHFSPERHWMNDPNGLVFYEGEYHLFYQYYPDGNQWGPMHWGHAISTDLVHWEHLPIALYPDSLGYIFSGSAVIDYENTSGLGSESNPAMIAIFTHHNPDLEKEASDRFQYQSIAYSTDKGRTFTKYKNNPVVPNPGIRDFRDPKVFWHEETERWVMVFAAYDRVMIYSSPDLLQWEKQSEFGIENDQRLWECPDLVRMKTPGGDEKWVLITSIQKDAPNGGTATSYFVGDFDGVEFTTNPQDQKWLDYGTDNYAFVTWSNLPEEDGVMGIGWMSNWQYAQDVPTTRWRSTMTLPRTLELDKVNNDYFLRSRVPEKWTSILDDKESVDIAPNDTIDLAKSQFKIDFSLSHADKTNFRITLLNEADDHMVIGWAPERNYFLVNRTKSGVIDFGENFASDIHWAPRLSDSENLQISLYVDESSIELFADDGLTVMTEICFPTSSWTKLLIKSDDPSSFSAVELSPLLSIWRK